MSLHRLWRCVLHHKSSTLAPRQLRRCLHVDGRNRLSNFWTPTGLSSHQSLADGEDVGHDLLTRAGFLRQAHSGIFHLLPLGLRVQNKIESLIDKHMSNLGASKVSLSSISSQDLWAKSGRLDGRDAEFFKLKDRKGTRFLLAPTHEEEITTIVAISVHSYKDLPLRLYQVSRKYRDEARPRQGLLRGREFIMKDLYTFDSTEANALETYDAVQVAYRGFFDDLAMPYLMAGADSGNMGGNYSHEYHLASPKGEDTVISCTSCDHSINEELYRESVDPEDVGAEFRVVYSQTKGETEVKTTWVKSAVADSTEPVRSKTLVTIYIPPYVTQLNSHALKDLLPELDTAVQLSDQLPKDFEDEAPPAEITIRDPRVDESVVLKELGPFPVRRDIRNSSFGLSQAKSGEKCPKCTSGTLQLNQAIEVGHTFHLGTRYSKPLAAKVLNAENKEVDIAMGCHGVGVSRLMGAAASLNADEKGLNWPVMIAPFTVIIMSAGKVSADDVSSVYDEISKHRFELDVDAIIDDREKPLGWRLKDADLVGYPFIIVLGKSWAQNKKVEIQCRALGLRENVTLQDLTEFIGLHCDRLRNHAVERKQG